VTDSIRQLAEDVISLAEDAGMPDSYQETDSRMVRARRVLERDDWKRTRWWRVIAPDGSLWCESSDEEENRESMRPGDTLECLWRREHIEQEWREEDA
jgi:alkylated DNA nucleotide flippase Atl1